MPGKESLLLSSSSESHAQEARQQRMEDTIASLQQAVQLAPRDARNHYNLGIALGRKGRLEEALACFQRTVELTPRHAGTHNNLGETLRRLGRLEEAVAWLRQAIELQPDAAEAHNNLGVALFDLGDMAGAVQCYQQALRIRPHYAEALNNLGNALRDLGRLEEAEAHLRQAVVLLPGYAEAHSNLGLTLRDQNRVEEARACFERSLRLRPDNSDALTNLGSLLQELGDLEGAAASFREALRVRPGHSVGLASLGTLLRGKLPDPERELLQKRLADPHLTNAQQSGLHFALAQVLDGQGQYAPAAAHLEQANALERVTWRKRGQEYDPADNARFVERLTQIFTPAFFERVQGWGSDSRRPVFLFGMPRSGTTLLEQILASHSQVHGGGELPFGEADFDSLAEMAGGSAANPALRRELSLRVLGSLNQAQVQRLAQQHLNWLRTLNATAARVTSKMPANWLYVGLLATIFPRATFIHCRRDPRDVVLSCWMTRFQRLNWTCDPDHLASRFRDYRRLMDHWRATLPVPMLEIDYEQTVEDPEGTARRLVDAMGLDWEPACLEFHKVQRPIRTASAVQVRQPLYRTSVGRWRNYAKELERLFRVVQTD